MRRFYLINKIGEQYSLNSHKTGFLQSVKGLGWVQTTDYVKTGNAWARSHSEDVQTSISGQLLFSNVGSTPYDKYAAFNYWIRQAKSLTLVYETSAGTYYKDVDYIQIDKKEITEGNVLLCDVEFMPLSLWYKQESEQFSVNLSDTTSRFSLSFPVTFHDYSNGNVVVQNDGSVEAGFTVSFTGPILNPRIELVTDGETKVFEVSAEADNNEVINYSSRDNDVNVTMLDSDGNETNLFYSLDISNENFFKVPIGTSTIKFSAESDIVNPIYLNIFKEYRTV